MIFRSVRARLTCYYTLALAAIMLVFSAGVYFSVRADLRRQMDALLERDLRVLSSSSPSDLRDPREIEYGSGIQLFRMSGRGTTVRSDGWKSAGLDRACDFSQTTGRGQGQDVKVDGNRFYRWAWRDGSSTYYLAVTGASLRDEDEHTGSGVRVVILVARNGDMIDRSLHSLATMAVFGFIGGIVLAVAGGYLLAGRVLAPVGAMASNAAAITADKLSERLPVHNPDDELGRLAVEFNRTLARLEDSFGRLRRFTSDASHELRTPLTAMKAVGEVSLRKGSDPVALRESICSMLEEADRLARLVNSLLTLTRADVGTARLEYVPTDLGELTSEVIECLRVLADEKDITLSADLGRDVTAQVDRPTFRQAVLNLLDNAIKYTPAGGNIDVAVRRANGTSTVEVRDNGQGIAEEHRDHVFERFYRVEKARSDARSAGLGLSIAKWAVEANGGAIELESEVGKGSTFRIVLNGECSPRADFNAVCLEARGPDHQAGISRRRKGG